ncbi:MAG: hypothetical protein O4808_11135, partial [Trichodesmium sp. St17_bin3_1_1]|nr:hypothetical protein [Trichodesmium sp. St17_bin3_1_1]
GIRTHGDFHLTRFQVERIRPLCHLSLISQKSRAIEPRIVKNYFKVLTKQAETLVMFLTTTNHSTYAGSKTDFA